MGKRLTLETVFSAVDRLTGPAKTMQSKLAAFNARAQASFGKTSRASSALGNAIRGMLPALSVAAGAKAIASFAERGDEIARNASILGLSAKAYQELGYAAKMADLDQEMFAASTKKLNYNLGQLKKGEGTLYTTLKGTNAALARQLRSAKSTDEAFDLVASAIAKETNVQKRATLAQAAFGKSGQDLIPMMADLAKMRAEARDSGTIISDKDIATASRLDDSLKRLKAQGLSLANQSLALVAEKLAPIAERAAKWVQLNKEFISLKVDRVFDAIGKGAVLLGKAWDSGVIPGILGGVVAFKALNTVLAISNALAAANPLMLTVTALAALIGLIVANWDKISAFFKHLGGDAATGTGIYAKTSNAAGGSRGYDEPGTLAPISPVSTTSYAESLRREERETRVSFDWSGLPPGMAARVANSAPVSTLNRGNTMAAVSGGAH